MKLRKTASGASTACPLDFASLPAEVGAGEPLEIVLAVLPPHPSSQIVVERRSNGRVMTPVRGERELDDPVTGAQRFRVRLPALAAGEAVELAPVVTRAGLVVQRLPVRTTRAISAHETTAAGGTPHPAPAGVPRYDWAYEFLCTFTVKLNPPESFGPGPDGLRLTYCLESGEVRGPRINGRVRGGDWMVLRQDGVAVADARITYETDDGALLFSRYSGILDLGQDGYKRALRNEYDPSPPVVLAPQFTTSHPNWLWLNRLQCVAVGRASMADLIVRLDIYAIRVGQLLEGTVLARPEGPLSVRGDH